MVRQLEVHRGRRGFAVDLDLQGVQGGLVGLGGQAQGQAGVDSSEAEALAAMRPSAAERSAAKA